ncbi:hypothetical protein DRH29_04895 [candidate division Kazan bacterium]|uniref:Uncharacterized protein n=1 Tax=candidate division Kazan bacterium TaxID=2202143 RepID=A0A420ZBM3_UNCK3|nr:MAG: hypothetical protein DRH29_04895 [candidate division Kazan bacterium]
MSHMKISKEEDARMTESRNKLLKAMMLALGSYIEQEAKKLDQWRDQSFGQLYAHLKHEIAEIGRSKTKTQQLHNCIDACALSAMLIAKLLEE